ncbi:MAG: hypothetical protein JSR25_00275 [Proteobacteria bacterium]|nr:hypothetical protein [Pseudomonadota bacterium]
MKTRLLVSMCLFGAALGSPAFAAPQIPTQNHIGGILRYPGAPKPVSNDPSPSPYAMTFADEAARSLGVQNGRMDVFSTRSSSSYMPSISGGVGSDGVMLRLRWHPGE